MWQMAKMKGLEIFSPKEWDVPDSNIEIILKKKNIIEKMNQGRSTIGSMGIEKQEKRDFKSISILDIGQRWQEC